MFIPVAPARILRWLTVLTVVFAVLHAGAWTAWELRSYSDGVLRFFDLNSEESLATWVQSILLLACGLALLAIAVLTRRAGGAFVPQWAFLGLVFLGLSADESIALHERTNGVAGGVFGTDGLLTYAWVVPGFVFAVAVFGFCARFLLSLPESTARVFLASGAIFVFAVIGVEMLEALAADAADAGRPAALIALQTVQESLEMFGASLFLFGLLEYLRDAFGVNGVALIGRFPASEPAVRAAAAGEPSRGPTQRALGEASMG